MANTNRGKYFYKGTDINDIITTNPNAQEDPSKYVGFADILDDKANYNYYKRNTGIGYSVSGQGDLAAGKSAYDYVVCNNSQRVNIPAAANMVTIIGIGGGGGGGGSGGSIRVKSNNAGNTGASGGTGGNGKAAVWDATAGIPINQNYIDITVGAGGNGGNGQNQYHLRSNWKSNSHKSAPGNSGGAGGSTNYNIGGNTITVSSGGAGGAGGEGASGNARGNSVNAHHGPSASNTNANSDTQKWGHIPTSSLHDGNLSKGKPGDGGSSAPSHIDQRGGNAGVQGQAIVVFIT